VAANCGDPGAKVPARPVRFVQPGYVPPMTTARWALFLVFARYRATSGLWAVRLPSPLSRPVSGMRA